MKTTRRAALALILALAATAVVASGSSAQQLPVLKGVHPERLSAYTASKSHFVCFDGSAKIPISAVNDDYCDCLDGSDEPGTSACESGIFFCTNAGHEPAAIRSSAVNDGVCEPECCDGSDEYSGLIRCPNTCAEAAAAARRERQAAQLLARAGASKRRELIAAGTRAREARIREIEQLKIRLESAERRCKRFEEIKRIAEEQDAKRSAALERSRRNTCEARFERVHAAHQKALSLVNRLRPSIESAIRHINEMPEDLLKIPAINALRNTLLSTSISDQEFKEAELRENDGTEADENQHETLHENDDDQDDLADAPAQTNSKSENQENFLSDDPCVRDDAPLSDCLLSAASNVAEIALQACVAPWSWSGWNKIYQTTFGGVLNANTTIPSLTKAREQFNAADRDRQDIQRRLDELTSMDKRDLGPNGEWTTLYGQCIKFEDPQYTYEVCLLEKANQKSRQGDISSSEVSLGRFSRWGRRNAAPYQSNDSSGSAENSSSASTDKDGEKYFAMMFENGMGCWNGPARSAEVVFTCGSETKLISVEEPSKCEYQIQAITPAVCSLNVDLDNNAHDSAEAASKETDTSEKTEL